MKTHNFILFFILSLVVNTIQDKTPRRNLHQPLFPVSSEPPPDVQPPPPPETPSFPSPDQPFFPEVPSNPTQPPPPPPAAAAASSSNGPVAIPAATQPAKQTKTVAIAISVGIVTLGMLSALAFFLYRHKAKHSGDTQKLVGGNSERSNEDSRTTPPPSSFLYIGTVEPTRVSVTETNGANGSPYHKLRETNSVKRPDRYRPSPDLQPLPPLPKPEPRPPPQEPASSSSDEDSYDATFYTPQGSIISNDDSTTYTAATRLSHPGNGNSAAAATASSFVPNSKRTSPKSRFSSSSPDVKRVMIPSIKQAPPQPPPPPPPPPSLTPPSVTKPTRPKFSSLPPPPDLALLQSLASSSPQRSDAAAPTPPPPPPPPPPPRHPKPPPSSTVARMGNSDVSPSPVTPIKVQTRDSSTRATTTPSSESGGTNRGEDVDNGASSSEKVAKLKPLHWDKVRATSDRATVWDQLNAGSFQLNEDRIESLFGCNSTNSVAKDSLRKSVLPPVEKENRVLDPKKSQNIAILLRALNVTRDEVSEALLDGNPESLGAELLETLVKMAPTKEEEIKLRNYNGDISRLGSAERFLKAVLDIPFAFKRVEAMLYRANFDAEVKYLRKSFETLEEASHELKNSRLFLKLLEAVLRTGNRMNVGTNRGGAKAFKLETLLKLVDVKGTDGKTTLLHFVVQEIIRSEGENTDSTDGNKVQLKAKEDNFRKQGLQVVAGLSRDLSNVKNAAGMDSDVLSSYVSKLEKGLEIVRMVLQYENPDMQGKFFESMKLFVREAEEEITRVKADEKRALSLVKEVTEYFHGDAAKEEAHPFRIFMIVRDFLSILDNVCKEVGRLQDNTMVGTARSFRISAATSLPVLNRYNVRQDRSSDEESSSP